MQHAHLQDFSSKTKLSLHGVLSGRHLHEQLVVSVIKFGFKFMHMQAESDNLQTRKHDSFLKVKVFSTSDFLQALIIYNCTRIYLYLRRSSLELNFELCSPIHSTDKISTDIRIFANTPTDHSW